MRRFSMRRQESFEEPTVNLTPLIDVVFVILIGFILIAPLLEIDQIQLADAPKHPLTQTQTFQEASPISIYVKSNNTLIYAGRQVTQEALLPLLQKAKKMHPKAIPQIFHDKKAYFGTYQYVKNSLESAGFDQVDVILEP